jgi:uncharacterized protein YndB with AHSA1/START domain
MTRRVDQASRTIHASPSSIFHAFEDPRALESWLPPRGMTGRIEAFDFRDGGSYRMSLIYRDENHPPGKSAADRDDVEVRFVRLVRDRTIEQAVVFDSEDPDFAGVMGVVWTFQPGPSGTEVTVRFENVPEGIKPQDHEAGLASTLENLARFVE